MTKLGKTQPMFRRGESADESRVTRGSARSAGALSRRASSPPPAGKVERQQTRPPRGRRTPAAPVAAPDFGPDLPAGAPGWMRRARRLSTALEQMIEQGSLSASAEASIERAFAAFELGSTDRHIAHVAHLVERAHRAIRNSARAELETAAVDCAEVLHQGLPPHVARRVTLDVVVDVVRGLRAEADGWKATVDGTSALLGWTGAASGHAAHAVRVALVDAPPRSEPSQ